MSLVHRFEDGYQIGPRVLYAVSERHVNMVHCAARIGPIMDYEKTPLITIDYPGEYDVSGMLIKTYAHKNNSLHHVIQWDDNKIVIVDEKSILKNMDTNDVDLWLYNNPKVGVALDKLEYDGDRQVLAEL